MSHRYIPAPVPQDDNEVLRAYLDSEFRRISLAQRREVSLAVLYGAANNVVANDTSETPILNYTNSERVGKLAVDAAAGTITLPPGVGVVEMNIWLSLSQVTSTRNFTVQLLAASDGIWSPPIISAGYLPQQGSDVRLGIGNSLVTQVSGGEVIRLGLLLDGATPATFQVDSSTFEITYLETRG